MERKGCVKCGQWMVPWTHNDITYWRCVCGGLELKEIDQKEEDAWEEQWSANQEAKVE